ncbi:FAD/NAD(P)-binding domain-containing protein [Leucogyrophana mollusca]|uniref:FAD/NAD(P)-binding domain-containing protein n=1 Tax=Leucogyrophana mollusca TaxID=85980 RepID=A0ACB8AZ72_9AGAM|nr:FAD/NAD(P)-binding domain-containing protein [Leucogyrophana mollusca]
MVAGSTKASLCLSFIIVGGGVAGLATAFRLCQAGHHVRVLDKSSGPNQRAGGTHLPPNLTKVLVEWGFGEKLAQHGLSTRASKFISMDSGDVIGCLEWKEDVLQESGADYLLMHYQDLHNILYEAAISAGAQISYNKVVVRALANPPRVQLLSGEELYADLIIGADGPQSVVRESIEGRREDGTPEGHSVYVAVISRELLKGDAELYELTGIDPCRPSYPIWTGTSRHVLGLTVRGGAEFAIHAFWPDSETDGGASEDGWDVLVPRERINVQCESKLRRLLDLAPDMQRIRLVNRPVAEDWVDHSGRLILIGEAAHPLYPGVLQSCSMQVEDAEVFGSLFSQLRSWDQLPHLIEGFQDLRQSRTRNIHEKETRAFQTVWVPPGPERQARDEALRSVMVSGWQGWDEKKMRWQWEEICEVFGYSASEAAEDWWVMWGMLRERSRAREGQEGLYTPIEVTHIHDGDLARDDR